jgi:alpha,alpha-trehalase
VNPPHLFARWHEVAPEIAAADSLALFSDFDGTLVPIRRDPRVVSMAKLTQHLLRDFAASGHVVGIVSGRALDDVKRRVNVPGLWYAGVHGFYISDPEHTKRCFLTRVDRAHVAKIAGQLQALLREVPGVIVERKVAAVAVHYRGARLSGRHAAKHAVLSVVNRQRGLRILPGDKVWEVMPAVPIDKSAAVRFILQRERPHASRRRRLAIYLGDDVADERVFGGWKGISVAVGRRRPTNARFSLRSPEEVRIFLKKLLKLHTFSVRF